MRDRCDHIGGPDHDERLAVALDFQDLTAHRLSAIGIQLGAATRLRELDTERCAGALTAAFAACREGLQDLRRLAESSGEMARLPLPHIGDPAALERIVADAGARLHVAEPAVLASLPGGVALSAFRALELLLGGMTAGSADVTLAVDGPPATLDVIVDAETVLDDPGMSQLLERVATRIHPYRGSVECDAGDGRLRCRARLLVD